MRMPLNEIGRLPSPQDNVAIATRTLHAGTTIIDGDREFTLSHTILVGHRFAVQTIDIGKSLLSWGFTFGVAIKPIAPGDYLCNADVLSELGRRSLDFALPAEPNFKNELEPYTFNESTFQSAPPLPRYTDLKRFSGYRRAGDRGVGTRNMIVLLGTTSLVSGFVRTLESRLQPLAAGYANIDGIVAVTHTEGGHAEPNNRDLLLRTLAGFMTHPNVGAVLALDYGYEAVTNVMLRDYMTEQSYPLDDVIHQWISLSGSFERDLERATDVVSGWLDRVNEMMRTDEPVSELKIALQCGGSDAFSGVSGNPLAAWVAKEIIQYGGSANLAETDELIGAETYALDKVRNAAVAHKFLSFIERFKERVGWHGHSADGNPSGGNKYRGLYNIYLKSLGAATKRHPDVLLDAVIDYSERMPTGGFYFMDSPGNDLESIAGQVASGCNIIFFVTGNGSITNFPFVPTIKIVTTTDRYQLLSDEMDVNAGAYLDGTPLDELGRATLDLTVDVASGQLSVGEKAGHAQVQIWRDWMQTQPANLNRLQTLEYAGAPIAINADIDVPDVSLPVYRNGDSFATDQVGLILPTSLCSGQIARMCVEQLNNRYAGQDNGLSRFVTLVHTEGCGGSVNNEFRDSLLGYLAHPFVKYALLLEHGCEITHNAYFRQTLLNRNLNPQDFGWASIQLDGGIQNVLHKVIDWFHHQLDNNPISETATAGLESVRLALTTQGEVTDNIARAFADLTQMIIAAGGVVVVSEQDRLLDSPYIDQLQIAGKVHPSLNYGDTITQRGFHIMATPTRDWGEILTGLGATGVEIVVSSVHDQSISGHPLIPVLQVTDNNLLPEHLRGEIDVFLSAIHLEGSRQLLESIVRTLSHDYTPKLTLSGNVNFQITRGLLGVSL